VTEVDRKLYERSWKEARPLGGGLLRLLDRHRSRGAWFQSRVEPIWKVPRSGYSTEKPPIVVFYSFKGGVGRSTALASFAIQRARAGERVVAVDADLDAPGIGTLLSMPDLPEGTARWGVVDYLLERPQGEVELRDYYHGYGQPEVTRDGEILTFPSGRVDGGYLGKLARVDLEPRPREDATHPLQRLLEDVRARLQPHWILVDARAGLADPAGMLLGGLAHLHVLFGTFSDQSWAGLRLVIERLGGERVRRERPQADCLVVQAMVPENVRVAEESRRAFADRARDEFVDAYYAEDPSTGEARDDFWYVGDADGSDAPHVPVPLSYSSKLADFGSIDDVAEHLAESPEYRRLASRIADRFGAP